MRSLTEKIIHTIGTLGMVAGMLFGAYAPARNLITDTYDLTQADCKNIRIGAGIMIASGLGYNGALKFYYRRRRKQNEN